jgi:hypothetical protein
VVVSFSLSLSFSLIHLLLHACLHSLTSHDMSLTIISSPPPSINQSIINRHKYSHDLLPYRYMLKRPPGFIDLVHVAGKGIVRGACKPVMLCSCVSRTPPRDYSDEGIRIEGDLLPESTFGHDSFSRQAPDTESQRLYFVLRDHQTSKPAKVTVPVTYSHFKWDNVGNSDGNGGKDDGSKHYSAPYLRCCANAGGKTEAGVEVTWGEDDACGPWQPLANLHVHSKNTLPFMSRACTCDE